MNWTAIAAAVALCFVMATAEGLLTRRDFPVWLNSLKRPRFYAPFWVWVAVALMTYGLQGVIAYRLIVHGGPVLGGLSLIALAGVMAANVAYNVVLDRTRNPTWAYRGLLYFLPALGFLQMLLFVSEPASALLNLAYVAWVVLYDVPIMRDVAKLNPDA
jgi:tryptophan-rich sensory protein